MTPTTPIWCPWCQQEHPAADFNKESRRYSGLHGICRRAQAEKRQLPAEKEKTRQRNSRRWADPEYRAASLEWQRARRTRQGATADLKRASARLQRVVDAWKEQGCVDCGYSDIRAIDPDHKPGEAKVGHISRMVTMCASVARIEAELAKCEPRCVRCHRMITASQRPCAWRNGMKLPPSWRRRLQRQDANDLIKLHHGCRDCGWAGWARGLDWDHVRGAKVAGIATMIGNGVGWHLILEEMAKCEVVCANCHRIRTCERRPRSVTN